MFKNPLLTRKLSDYEETRELSHQRLAAQEGKQPGDAVKAAEAIADVVRGEGKATGKRCPLWLVLGKDAEDDLRRSILQRLQNLDEWQEVTRSTTVDDDDIVLI